MKLFCVVVPAYNEELVIKGTLLAIIAAGAKPEDIYVVDDNSKDKTGEIAKALGVTVLRNEPNIGKTAGLKKVIETYRLVENYEFLSIIDADTLVDERYYAEMHHVFRKDQEVMIACGRPIPLRHNWLTEYRALCYANGHYVYRSAQGKYGLITIAPGCSTMYRMSVIPKLDWENGTTAEDMYWTIQVQHQLLGKVAYVGTARVYTQTPRKLMAHCKQRLRWDGGTWQVIRLHKIYKGTMAIDWECKILWTEGLITGTLRMCMPIMLVFAAFYLEEWIRMPWYQGYPLSIVGLYVGGYLLTLPTTIIFTLLMKRWSILLYSPLYMILRDVDAFIFLYSFVKVIILDQKVPWFSPPRYARS